MSGRRIITRAEWGARPPKQRRYISTPTPELWLHHSAGALDAGGNGVWWDDVRGIQEFHMRPVAQGGRGWSDIAYSFLIGGGLIFEGRGVGVAGGHTAGRNSVSHAICLIGNYEVLEPTDEDLDAIAWLIAHGKRQGWWGDLTGPHREAPGASTACCGRHLIARIPDLRRAAAAHLEEEDDMFSDEDRKLLREVRELVGPLPRITTANILDGKPRQERATIEARIEVAHRTLQAILAILTRLVEQRPDTVNVAALAAEIVDALDDDMAAAVLDGLGRRLTAGKD